MLPACLFSDLKDMMPGKLKKFLGRTARRYAPRSYRMTKRLLADLAEFPGEARVIIGIWRKRLPSGTPDADFMQTYYSDTSEEIGSGCRQGIVCMYDGRILHGGLTDRLRGVLSTYREARRRRIPFYISWTHPFRLEDYLEPTLVDWRIPVESLTYSSRVAFPVMIQDCRKLSNALRLRAALRRRLPQTHVYSNSYNAKGEYASLYRELFQPTASLRREVEFHRRHLGDNYVSFSFRFLQLLGDFEDVCGETLPPYEQTALLGRVTDEFRRMLTAVPPEWRVLVASDSRRFLSIAPSVDHRIYVVKGDVKHVDVGASEGSDVWMKTFVDQQLISGARKVWLMRTGKMYRSGFPSFAAEVGGVPFEEHVF